MQNRRLSSLFIITVIKTVIIIVIYIDTNRKDCYHLIQVSAYCVGNLNMPENPLPWETLGQEYASNLATPVDIMVDASNGASDYGNYIVPSVCV